MTEGCAPFSWKSVSTDQALQQRAELAVSIWRCRFGQKLFCFISHAFQSLSIPTTEVLKPYITPETADRPKIPAAMIQRASQP